VDSILKGHLPPAVLTANQFSGGQDPDPSLSTTAEQTTASFFRAPGDDFSLLYLVGVPPLVNVARP